MRVKPALPVALAALALSGAAWAQQYNIPTNPPANPQEIVPDQRLENIDARLVWVTGQLRDAADTGEEKGDYVHDKA